MQAYAQKIIVAVLTLLMIACGFQLRGTIDANFKSLSVYGGSEGLSKHLKKRFKQSGIEINTQNPERILEIISDKLDKRILSLSSTGSVQEYELDYEVKYRFKTPQTEWSEQLAIKLTRTYTYDDEKRVAKELEEKNLIDGMRDEVVRSIVNQMIVIQ
ncbi:MAG: LPS assembly lipoprotein LptE [Methylophilaceae bacterium]